MSMEGPGQRVELVVWNSLVDAGADVGSVLKEGTGGAALEAVLGELEDGVGPGHRPGRAPTVGERGF